MLPVVRFWTDWTFLFQRQNWYDFTFIYLFFENDLRMGEIQIHAAFFGLHIMLSWDTGETPERDIIKRKIEDMNLK